MSCDFSISSFFLLLAFASCGIPKRDYHGAATISFSSSLLDWSSACVNGSACATIQSDTKKTTSKIGEWENFTTASYGMVTGPEGICRPFCFSFVSSLARFFYSLFLFAWKINSLFLYSLFLFYSRRKSITTLASFTSCNFSIYSFFFYCSHLHLAAFQNVIIIAPV